MKRRLRSAIGLAALLFAWTYVVCFPNPIILPRNLYRYFRFPVDPNVVERLPSDLPDDSADLEEFLKQYIRFQWDWENYGVLWMMPEPMDVVRRRRGDCESVAVVLASVLEARSVPYDVQASFSHVWVDYPGKRSSDWEREGASYFGRKDGRLFVKSPTFLYLRQHLRNHKEGLWDVMPFTRKLVLLLGWIGLPAARVILWRRAALRHRDTNPGA